MNRDDTIYWISQLIPGELVIGEDVVTADLGDGQTVAVTLGFADVDTGLHAVEEELPVRSELIIVARASVEELTAVLRAAVAKFTGFLPAQPGTMLPQLHKVKAVEHGLFVPPYLWGGETPRVTEEERLTVLLQLVMLTDAEYAYAVEEGPGALQQALGEAGIDLLDWAR
ncbi:MAG: suppressor of fused domain protein [Corynebacterium sp.]|uniref:suppressor of fused domain protein n=1 Tax=Corynebacterium sp. TaxID=1720 RepID=UPI0026DF3603|nr:suppressor of fused domain protein [Corynebacterium sp.]MDO5668453.1 suppressor of fused domain protein [Corynebacterium sp.]